MFVIITSMIIIIIISSSSSITIIIIIIIIIIIMIIIIAIIITINQHMLASRNICPNYDYKAHVGARREAAMKTAAPCYLSCGTPLLSPTLAYTDHAESHTTQKEIQMYLLSIPSMAIRTRCMTRKTSKMCFPCAV